MDLPALDTDLIYLVLFGNTGSNGFTGTLPTELALLENTVVDYCKLHHLSNATADSLIDSLSNTFLHEDGNDIAE
jgi:hypothetical protein